MTRIAMIALGSRGDVQPYIALGKGLQTAGHDVRILTHEDYEPLVAAHGLAFRLMKGNVQAIVESPEMRELLAKGNFLAINAYTAKAAQSAALDWAKDGLAGCEGMDLLVAGIGGLNIGLALGEKLDIPLVEAHVVPFSPTAAFPGALFPPGVAKLGGLANRLSHHLTRQAMWQGYRAADKLARQQVLDLPPAPFWGPYRAARARRSPVLYGFSPAVLPKPPDWAENVHVTGCWFLESEPDWTPPPALSRFLQAGLAPVCLGFGSMSNRDPEETADLILRALSLAGQRAVILSGWGGFRQTDLPDTVMVMKSAPHDWLFARAAAVVHHGGAGTTAASLRSGVPTAVVPFFGDQPFWGRRVADLGVGPEPMPRRHLTAEQLARAIKEMVYNQTMRQQAASLGAAIRAENGIARAVALLQEWLVRITPPSPAG